MSETPRQFDLVYQISPDHGTPIEGITGDIVTAIHGLYVDSLIDTSERRIMLTVGEDNLGEVKSAMDGLNFDFISEELAA